MRFVQTHTRNDVNAEENNVSTCDELLANGIFAVSLRALS